MRHRAFRDTSTPSVCALVPVKQREHCKMRLASELTIHSRIALVRSMLSAVLTAAREARWVCETVVISPERDAVAAEIQLLPDAGVSLNSALTEAYETLWQRGRREFVILPADLPRIRPEEIDTLVHAGHTGGCALAPDMAGTGTNGLYLASPPAFAFQFGPDSCRRHLQEARRLGLAPQLVHLPGLAFDLDTPTDLAQWQLMDLPRSPSWPAPLPA